MSAETLRACETCLVGPVVHLPCAQAIIAAAYWVCPACERSLVHADPSLACGHCTAGLRLRRSPSPHAGRCRGTRRLRAVR